MEYSVVSLVAQLLQFVSAAAQDLAVLLRSDDLLSAILERADSMRGDH